MMIWALLFCNSLNPKPYPVPGCSVVAVHSDKSLATEMAHKFCFVMGHDDCISHMYLQEMKMAEDLEIVGKVK